MNREELQADPERMVGLKVEAVEVRDDGLYVRLEEGVVIHSPEWDFRVVDDPFVR